VGTSGQAAGISFPIIVVAGGGHETDVKFTSTNSSPNYSKWRGSQNDGRERSLMCNLPAGVIERSLVDRDPDQLIIAKRLICPGKLSRPS
jgi:hypothetical protein